MGENPVLLSMTTPSVKVKDKKDTSSPHLTFNAQPQHSTLTLNPILLDARLCKLYLFGTCNLKLAIELPDPAQQIKFSISKLAGIRASQKLGLAVPASPSHTAKAPQAVDRYPVPRV